MNPTLENLLNTALTLSDEDRVELVEALIASLQPKDRPPFAESWREVIQQRSAELRSGQVAAVPWDEGSSRPSARLTAEQRAELARRNAELDAHPERALSWEQIRASVEASR